MNKEHYEILKQGVDVWNKWREENRIVHIKIQGIDLRDTNLSGFDFSGITFDNILLGRADLNEADFSGAILNNCNFSDANLYGTFLIQSKLIRTTFLKANICKASFIESSQILTSFIECKFEETDFKDSELMYSVFGLTDFGSCKGFDSVKVVSPCVIDFPTLRYSNFPRSFLRKIGLPEIFIDYLPEFVERPINLFPVFLSHSSDNKAFAGKLYEALIDKGVQVWYDEKKMKPGDDIYEVISKGINTYDKMILVCSEDSLNSWWVDEELNRIFAKERKYTKEKGKKMNLLIPITIDDHIYNWEGSKSGDIKDRYVIGNFKEWQNEEKFEKALNELIAALNVDRQSENPISYL